MKKKMAFVGGGNMAEALIKGLLSSGTVAPEDIRVSDLSAERLELLQQTYGIVPNTSNAKAVQEADAVWLCVKPQQMEAVLPELTSAVPNALFISIAAGVPTKTLEHGLGEGARVVRVMPNTPALIGEGAAGLAGGANADALDLDLVKTWMSCVGQAVIVEEDDLHAVTALSGSGPAYVFYLMESMLEAGLAMGVEPQVAKDLVVQTIIGAGKLFAESDCSAGELRERVTSKGGTTFAALETFRAAGVGDGLRKGVEAAAARSLELAGS